MCHDSNAQCWCICEELFLSSTLDKKFIDKFLRNKLQHVWYMSKLLKTVQFIFPPLFYTLLATTDAGVESVLLSKMVAFAW